MEAFMEVAAAPSPPPVVGSVIDVGPPRIGVPSIDQRELERDRSARYLAGAAWIAITVVAGYVAYQASRLFLLQRYEAGSYSYDLLFSSAAWAIPAAAVIGIVAGALRPASAAPLVLGTRVRRHDAGTFFEHWSVTISSLALIATGILLGNVFNRRVFEGAEPVGLSMNLHFFGALLFVFIAFHHTTYYLVRATRRDIIPLPGDFPRAIAHYAAKITRRRAPREAKYMSSAKLAYLAWAVVIAGLIVTGTIKVGAHVSKDVAPSVMQTMTWLHDVFGLLAVALLVVHLAVVVLPSSWPLLRSMFTGFVPADYVRQHHEDWHDELRREGHKV